MSCDSGAPKGRRRNPSIFSAHQSMLCTVHAYKILNLVCFYGDTVPPTPQVAPIRGERFARKLICRISEIVVIRTHTHTETRARVHATIDILRRICRTSIKTLFHTKIDIRAGMRAKVNLNIRVYGIGIF